MHSPSLATLILLAAALTACAQSVSSDSDEGVGGSASTAGNGGAAGSATTGDPTGVTSSTTGVGAGTSSSSSTSGSGGSTPGCSIDNECIYLAGPCVKGICDASKQCAKQPIPDGGACEDGNKCTVGETCNANVCSGGAPKDCSALTGVCGDGICDTTTGDCDVAPKNEGAACDDADPCTSSDACASGACTGVKLDCTALDSACVLGVCNPATLACEAQPQTGPACDDANPCTLGDACNQGACVAGPVKDCTSLDSTCTTGVCSIATGNCTAAPANEGGVCDDANVCTAGEICTSGACVGAPANEGSACSDGISCTSGETCTAGVCAAASPKIYLYESFGGAAPGWTLGPEWEIGPAQSGGNDPGMDHTSSGDNGVAGVVLGGYADKMLHASYYLESPAVNVGGPGTVVLSFYRYLDCLWDAWTHHTVEVFDGASWQTLWTSDFPGVSDSDWTLVTYDLTPYKNPALKVRFGFDMVSLASMGSWNVDDVAIGEVACP